MTLPASPSLSPSTTSLRTHHYASMQAGPRLIVLGAVHGNETCGTRALERLIAELDQGRLNIVRGQLTVVPITNPLAYLKGERMGQRNLNRNLVPQNAPQDYEDHLANILCPLLAQHDVLLDLHSFHTPGEPFAMLGPGDNQDALEPFKHARLEEALVCRLGARRVVEGWLDTYAIGVRNRQARQAVQALQAAQPTPTPSPELRNADVKYGMGTTEYMRSQGGYAITLECGQHADPQAPEVAYRAIRNTLAHLHLIDEPSPPGRTDIEVLRLTEVTDRLDAADTFARPWASFDPVQAGELVGRRADGTELRAPQNGFIVFPNPKALPGFEWFYFAQHSRRVVSPLSPLSPDAVIPDD